MKVRFIRHHLALCILCWLSIPSLAAEPDTGIKHIVFCWLQEPGQPEQINQVIETSKELQIIPGVMNIAAGPAVPSERPIVDDSFDVGIVMTFKNTADLTDYLSHEEHTSRVNRVLGPLCQRVLVYDIAY